MKIEDIIWFFICFIFVILFFGMLTFFAYEATKSDKIQKEIDDNLCKDLGYESFESANEDYSYCVEGSIGQKVVKFGIRNDTRIYLIKECGELGSLSAKGKN